MASDITQIDTTGLNYQTYESSDVNLIPTFEVNTALTDSSYIEFFVYDINQNLLYSDFSYTGYTVLNDGQSPGNNNISQLILNPETDLLSLGFDQGEYVTYYNFLNKDIGSDIEQLYIAEISSDRREIRLDSTALSNLDIIEKTNMFIQSRTDSQYFLDFYINFGDNKLAIANNIVLDNTDPTNSTILVKLYEPLPIEYNVNTQLWVVSSIDESKVYNVKFEDEVIIFEDSITIQGPNYNLDIKDQVNNSTISLSYTDLINTSLTSSQNNINSLLEEKEIDINIDYTNFANFIHFSSAQTRIENFTYKIELIEQYSDSINTLNTTQSSSLSVSSSISVLESKIDSIITNFDGYDYFLYYSNDAKAWPKTNNVKPYTLAKLNSDAVQIWLGSSNEYSPIYGGLTLSASIFDNLNKDNLLNTIPEYLREDENNYQYELFVDMVAQHYDNIWIYHNEVTEKYNADNRLDQGISKDIIADAIRDFGIKLYQNNFTNDDLYSSFLGLTPNGSVFPFPNITGSLPTPSGYEYINTLISASNDNIPLDDVNKSLYKRIYHNLPYLLKSKGTLPGLRALITSYGIPDTVLRINEYGGKDKVNANDWDYWKNESNYAFSTSGSNFISSSFSPKSEWSAKTPKTVMFRFKADGISETYTPTSQSLWYLNDPTDPNLPEVALTLIYTGSALTSGSYSGSIIDPYYEYATLTLYPDITDLNVSASIYLPFFNNDWWSVMVTQTGIYDFSLFTQNKVYEGGDNGTNLGFAESSSVNSLTNMYPSLVTSFFPAPAPIINNYAPFQGLYQEIRYYSTVISESVFENYTMNPYSIESNEFNNSQNELLFRAPLGGDLYTQSLSIHPRITGSWIPLQSFIGDFSNFNFNSSPLFVPNEEYFFYNQPIVGIKNAVSDKIRIEDNIEPAGNVLSAFTTILQNSEVSASYTSNINLLEVAFSPQNEINDDIMSSFNDFNIGEYIGDPRLRSTPATTYPELEKIRNDYFEKYIKNYNLQDFIRLIKFFDNSLFKMIRDFVPARTSLASGIVIKQNLLERNKYPQPQLSYIDSTISGTLNPQWNDYNEGTVENFSGGTGGTFESYNTVANTSQSWDVTTPSPLGLVTSFHDSQDEFYNGEFSGSVITVTTQVLNPSYPLNITPIFYTPVIYSNALYNLTAIPTPGVDPNLTLKSSFTEQIFLDSRTVPSNGEILILKTWNYSPHPPAVSGNSYAKISKFDINGNDNTPVISQITTFKLISTSGTEYDIAVNSISEFPTYYLLSIPPQWQPTFDNYIVDYEVSASLNTLTLNNGTSSINYLTASYNPNNFYYSSSGKYIPSRVPNVKVDFTMSMDVTALTTTVEFQQFAAISGSEFGATTINSIHSIIPGGTTQNIIFTGSLNPKISPAGFGLPASARSIGNGVGIYFLSLNADDYYTGDLVINNMELNIVQTTAVDAADNDQIIFEPYITENNFYNSDYNPLLNNAEVARLSGIYQDIDYSAGMNEPVNLDLLLSGNALKAPVQDSNYSTRRHILPRYIGSKNSSLRLNEWTVSDLNFGTFGKTPSIDSKKTSVAYCEVGYIGGYSPDLMNSSGATIKYIINQDGTIQDPKSSPYILSNVQSLFRTGEKLIINSNVTKQKTIIRGGYRIEDILYTQIGHTPAQWTSSINLINNLSIPNVGNFLLKKVLNPLSPTNPISKTVGVGGTTIIGLIPTSPAGWTILYDPGSNTLGSGGWNYALTSNSINEGVDLIVDAQFVLTNTSTVEVNCIISLYKDSTSAKVTYQNINLLPTETKTIIFNYTLSPTDYINGDGLYFRLINYGPGLCNIMANGSYFNINQTPLPNPVASITVGTGSIWSYPTSSTYTQADSSNAGIIFIPDNMSSLNTFYNATGVRQEDVPLSGFEPVTEDWSVKVGDEFRFEGREDRMYMVRNVYSPTDQSPNRISNTGSLEVHLAGAIPSASINLDHFLIRRYVPDPSKVIFQGLKDPPSAPGPFILRPEFIVPELDRDIDTFIVQLNREGLI